MSRLDYLTIAIVGLLLFVLGFLIFKTVGLINSDKPTTSPITETVDDYGGDDADETTTYDDEYDASSDYGTDNDLDDDELPASADEDYDFADDYDTGTSSTDDEESVSSSSSGSNSSSSSSSPAFTSSGSSQGDYLVIAGSYKQKANAESQVRRLQKLGYNNAEVSMFNRGAFAVALVDRFDSQTDAQNLVKDLKAEHGVDAIVKKKR